MKTRAPLEKSVQGDIYNAMRLMGFDVNDLTQPRATMLPRGLPDLYCRHPRWGIRLWIECKRPGGKVSIYQQAWHRTERMAGGTVLVADSVGAVVDYLRSVGAPIT